MILPILQYGHKLLREPSIEVTADNCPDLKDLVKNMWETMYKAEGCGLAAPQVGRNLRLFIVDANELKKDYPDAAGFTKTFVNPEIVEESADTIPFREGCLSLPGISEEVRRHKTIKLRYQDENLQPHEEVITGTPAVCVQHEFDHILGRVFIDHLGQLRRRLLKNKLKSISQGKAGAKYRITLP